MNSENAWLTESQFNFLTERLKELRLRSTSIMASKETLPELLEIDCLASEIERTLDRHEESNGGQLSYDPVFASENYGERMRGILEKRRMVSHTSDGKSVILNQ